MTLLAPTLQAFFTERLIGQRQASPNTIAAYRDTFRLVLAFAAQRTGTPPSQLDIATLDAPLIAAFLAHLQTERGNSTQTRNNRLAAIHSLFANLALQHPEHAASIQRVLAIPPKRTERNLLTYLTEPEVDALLGACDQATWTGRRDHAMFALTIQTGLRISELIGLSRNDVALNAGAHVRCIGKGRKERATPLTRQTVAVLRAWIDEQHSGPNDPLFPASHGGHLSRDAVERLLTKHARIAQRSCPSLEGKRLSPHTLRHTSAMRLLHAGVDTTVIALWLGHETVDTTQIYLHAHRELKERALARTAPPHSPPGRYRPPDTLLAFLEGL